MSVKFPRASLAYFSAPDAANLTFPNSDWSLGFTFILDGTLPVSSTQYLFSTGNYGGPGSNNFFLTTDASGVTKLSAYVNAGGSPTCVSQALTTGGAYVAVFVRSSSSVNVKACPVLTTLPTNGASVITGTLPAPVSVAMDASSPMVLGTRATFEVARSLDQSACRFFFVAAALSDLDIAKLAYGMEITELGYNPLWYCRMNDANDFADRGSLGVPFTKTGTLATGTAMGFGYVPTNSAPAFTSAPTVDGTPQVGQTATYTRGGATGTPLPAVAQQWYVGGLAVVGATDPTYIPVTADGGKPLGVRELLSNSQGNAYSDSATKTIAAATNGIVLTPLQGETIYPRVGTTAAVAMSGTYTGTQPTSLEYQLYGVDGTTVRQAWTAMSSTIVAGGTWSAAPLIPQHTEKYTIAVRAKDSGGIVISTSIISTNRFGVGFMIAAGGSSTVATWFGSGSGGSLTPNNNSTSFCDQNGFRNFDGNGYISQVASYLAAQFGCCVGMINIGISGETLTSFAAANSGPYNLLVSNIALAGNRLEGLWFSAGSNDASNNYLVTSVAQHLAKWRSVISTVRTQCNQPNLPVLCSGMNSRPGSQGNAAGQDPMSDWVRQAETNVGDDANVYHVQSLDYAPGSDGVHLTGAGFQAQLTRNQYVWVEAVKNSTYRRGPKIVAFTFVGNAVTVTIQHRNGNANDFTIMANTQGFSVSDASGAATILTVERIDATHIKITCDRALVGPVVTKYLSGGAPPTSTPIYDNGTVPLPLTMDTLLSTTQGTAFATTVTFSVVDATGANVTGLVNLDYAFYDQPRINGGAAPIKSGSTVSVNNGVGSISIAGLTTLMPGGTGLLVFGDSSLVKAAIGQVVVS